MFIYETVQTLSKEQYAKRINQIIEESEKSRRHNFSRA